LQRGRHGSERAKWPGEIKPRKGVFKGNCKSVRACGAVTGVS